MTQYNTAEKLQQGSKKNHSVITLKIIRNKLHKINIYLIQLNHL